VVVVMMVVVVVMMVVVVVMMMMCERRKEVTQWAPPRPLRWTIGSLDPKSKNPKTKIPNCKTAYQCIGD
jgi:hypothetical protein